MRTINLGYGKGVEGQQACWMTALQSHLGGEWTDKCDCVSPAINRLCIAINDAYRDDDAGRTEDILEFGLFDPIGTNDPTKEKERRAILAKAAREVWAPKVQEFARAASASAAAAAAAYAAADAAADAYAAAAAAAAADASAAAAAAAAAYASADADADAAAYAAARKARRDFIKQYMFPVLREMIGDTIRQEVVPSESFYKRIGCGV